MTETYLDQLARANNGAIQVDRPNGLPLFVVLAGPIKVWWTQWDSPQHQRYVRHRDATEAYLVQHGILVYKPHTAWRGAWHEDAQFVNDEAIRRADVMIDLTPRALPEWVPLVECEGTTAEVEVAVAAGTTVVQWPPWDTPNPQLWLGRLLGVLQRDFPDRVYK